MREVKFRVWDKRAGLYHTESPVSIDSTGTMSETSAFIIEQFTGLRDKNRREIYEGDIVDGDLYDNRLPIRGAVVYDDRHCFYAIKNDAGITALFRISNIITIGNIHENQELLS